MRAMWIDRKAAVAGLIMTTLIAIILVTALAPSIVKQSDNARGVAMLDRTDIAVLENDYDNTAYAANAAPIFGLFPLFWSIVGIALVAGAVIAASKGF